ncbi:MAG: DNA-3-methyladenine glycosylase I [Candidatus Glassbacteria bacterium]
MPRKRAASPRTSKKDTLKRCTWCAGDPILEPYHDTEWGVSERNDNRLFERMALQIFQAGLNWKMILGKRQAFRKAFHNFDIIKVARFDGRSVKRLMSDESIIRNRRKIEAVIENARRLQRVRQEFGSFHNYIKTRPSKLKPLQKEFKERFVFMGPEITRMFVMNIGKVQPAHEKRCFRYGEAQAW